MLLPLLLPGLLLRQLPDLILPKIHPYVDLVEGLFDLLLVLLVIPELICLEGIVLLGLIHAGRCVNLQLPANFFRHSSFCMLDHSLRKFSVSGLILISSTLFKILMLTKRRRILRISSPVYRSKWQKDRYFWRLSSARLKFLILPNSLRRRIMMSLVHS